MRWAFAFSLAIVACGADQGSTDGGADVSDDVLPDAPATGACDLTAPFGPPVPIAELNTPAHEAYARLTHDELTIYFQTQDSADAGVSIAGPAGGWDLAMATRPTRTAPFGPPSMLTINSSSDDCQAVPTSDALTLYFASNRGGGGGGYDIWVATRTSTGAPFGSATNVNSLNNSVDQQMPYVLPSGQVLYLVNGSPGYMERHVLSNGSFSLDSTDPFAAVVSTSYDIAPVVSTDELTAYFASERDNTKGNDDNI